MLPPGRARGMYTRLGAPRATPGDGCESAPSAALGQPSVRAPRSAHWELTFDANRQPAALTSHRVARSGTESHAVRRRERPRGARGGQLRVPPGGPGPAARPRPAERARAPAEAGARALAARGARARARGRGGGARAGSGGGRGRAAARGGRGARARAAPRRVLRRGPPAVALVRGGRHPEDVARRPLPRRREGHRHPEVLARVLHAEDRAPAARGRPGHRHPEVLARRGDAAAAAPRPPRRRAVRRGGAELPGL